MVSKKRPDATLNESPSIVFLTNSGNRIILHLLKLVFIRLMNQLQIINLITLHVSNFPNNKLLCQNSKFFVNNRKHFIRNTYRLARVLNIKQYFTTLGYFLLLPEQEIQINWYLRSQIICRRFLFYKIS